MPMAADASMQGASVSRLWSDTDCIWEITEKGLAGAFSPMRESKEAKTFAHRGGGHVPERTMDDIRGPKAELLSSDWLSSEKV